MRERVDARRTHDLELEDEGGASVSAPAIRRPRTLTPAEVREGYRKETLRADRLEGRWERMRSFLASRPELADAHEFALKLEEEDE